MSNLSPYDYFHETVDKTPFRDTMTLYKQYIDNYVFDVFTNLTDYYSNTIDSVFIVFLVIYFLMLMTKLSSQKVADIILTLVMVTFVHTVIFNWPDFSHYIYDLITNGPLEIIAIVMSTVKTNFISNEYFPGNINDGMDIFLFKGMRLQVILWDQDGISTKLAAVIVLLAVFWLVIQGGGMIMYASTSIAIALSLTPLFMLFLLFRNTRGWFEGWMRELMTSIILQLLVFSLLAIILSVLSQGLGTLAELMPHDADNFDFSWGPLTPFLTIIGFASYMLKHIWGKAAAIGGGFAARAWEAYNDTGGALKAVTRGIDRSIQRIQRLRK